MKALNAYFAELNEKVQITEISNIEQQIVSGVQYRFFVKLTNAEGISKQAKAQVWSQPWLDSTKVTAFTYVNSKEKRKN